MLKLIIIIITFSTLSCSTKVGKDISIIENVKDSIVQENTIIDYSDEESYPVNFKEIYFDYNSSEIKENENIDNICEILLESNIKVRIVGTCDSRGSNAYNLALGQQRASRVRQYLVSYGIDKRRVDIFSYGEERPVCFENSEACWSKNRRVYFEVSNK